jgi:LuxR family maltose regulon positive regulatory protein
LPDNEFKTSLIQTKLNRPPLPVDLVPRPRLTDWLDKRRERPLTLVSAPAGYGKSTLISCWLESVDCPTAWLSLDERDNEFGVFLGYFLAAIQTVFPDGVPETQALLKVTPLPPVMVIANMLINELNQIEEPFILVLDDYFMLETQTILDLIKEMLLHPPRNLHLVLGTRIDPSLPLVTLRANSQVTEIRSQDLRFNQEETNLLFQKMLGTPIDQAMVSEIDTQAEGWVTGLRLAALAMRHRIGRDSIQGELSFHNRYVTEYLLNEILAKQSDRLSDCMLKTSILERFRADLCEAVCLQGAEPVGIGSVESEFNGERFLEWLRASNLFVIPLDDQHEWFRYHHLFREILQQELVRKLSPEEIAKLHAAAGRWCARNSWIEEALNHLLASSDTAGAIEVVAQHRYRMMNANRWPRLERWLNLFSPAVIESSAELWMLKTWLVYHHGLWSELPALLGQLATIMAGNPDQEITNNLAGEISSLHSLIAYHRGDAEEAITQAHQALENLPAELWIVRVLAISYLGLSLLATGNESGGYHAFYGALREEKVQNKRFKATMLMAACYFHWISADLQSTAQAARQSIAICPETDYQSILGYGKYNLGRVHYQQNDLAAAEELFASVVAKPYQNYGDCYTSSACGLVMTQQAQGREAEARQVTETTIAFLLETGNTTQLPVALALQTEVELMQGRIPTIGQWAEKLDIVPLVVPMIGFLAPHLTLIKVWLARNTPTSKDKAAKFLIQLREYLMGIHNTRFLIEVLALQALLDDVTGDQPAALASLEKALKLAQPGGFIRLFVDLGPQLAVLLSRLSMDRDLQAYVDQIRSAFSGSQLMTASISQGEMMGNLTVRELQILELLGERLTNKEIAAQLVIAPGTVKAHTIRIYQKLAVNGRQQAVQKAIALGILSPN